MRYLENGLSCKEKAGFTIVWCVGALLFDLADEKSTDIPSSCLNGKSSLKEKLQDKVWYLLEFIYPTTEHML